MQIADERNTSINCVRWFSIQKQLQSYRSRQPCSCFYFLPMIFLHAAPPKTRSFGPRTRHEGGARTRHLVHRAGGGCTFRRRFFCSRWADHAIYFFGAYQGRPLTLPWLIPQRFFTEPERSRDVLTVVRSTRLTMMRNHQSPTGAHQPRTVPKAPHRL